MRSLSVLFLSPYNKKYPLRAIFRFIYWKVIKLFRLNNVTYHLWGNRKINLYHNSFQCMWLMYNYLVDFEEFNLIQDYVKPGDHVADVGANMGYYTIWMSKFISSGGSIHSFEPNEANYKLLINNCALNKLQNTVFNKIALSDRTGNVLFTKSLDGENHIALSSNADTSSIACTTLDEYASEKNITHFSYIKVDIEGFEIDFIKGAEELLKNTKIDIIQLEINERVSNSMTTKEMLLNKIAELDYMLCKYDVATKQLVETNYNNERENYFMVSSLALVNKRLIGGK